ncbi:MAG: hypothetical protein KDD50_05575 [Bdellovibrionales bacterium]|nr:hypothetical protein [Bdellovibrionales bacterium]
MNLFNLKKITLLFVTLLFSVNSFGQTPKAYIDFENDEIGRRYLNIDGKKYPFSPWSGRADIDDAIIDNSAAKEYYEMHKTASIRGLWGIWGGLGLAVTYALTTVNQYDSDGKSIYNSGVYWGLFLVPFIYGTWQMGKSQVYLQKTINSLNGVSYSEHSSSNMHKPIFHLGLLNYSF